MARKNGFSRPFTKDQIFTWIALPIAASSYYLIAAPFIEDEAIRASLLAIYSILLVAVLFSWFMCSALDPADEGGCFCICMKEAQKETKYCNVCKKHVPGLDHHCVWLNTCIGKRQYPYFYSLAACGTFMSILHTVVGILLLTTWYDEERAEQVLSSADTYKTLISIVVVGAIGLIGAFGTLFIFHTMLLYQGMGTYSWLIHRHEVNLEKKHKKEEKRREATRSIEESSRDTTVMNS